MHNCDIYEEAASCGSSKKLPWTVIHHDPSPVPMPISPAWSSLKQAVVLTLHWYPDRSADVSMGVTWILNLPSNFRSLAQLLLHLIEINFLGGLHWLHLPLESIWAKKKESAPDADVMHLTTDCCHWCCFSARQLTCHWWRSGPRYSPPTSRWDDDKPGLQLCLEKIPNREKYLRSIDGCLCC